LQSPAYVLCTPMRDEMEHLPELLASVDAQSVRPALWLVVDDHSEDGSLEWLEEQAAGRPWLQVLSSPEAPDEYLGNHIARIKSCGLEQAIARAEAEGREVGFAGVLDADIALPADHYERLVAALEAQPEVGVVSSVLETISEDGVHKEPLQRADLPRGPTQFFRRACLDAIGGLPRFMGYDGAANAKAILAGWRTRVVGDVVARHRRPTATRFGVAAGFARRGRYAWFLGHSPILVAARGLAYTRQAPHTGGYHFVRAWLSSAVHRAPRCDDPQVRHYYGRTRVKENVKAVLGLGPRFFRSR